MILQIPHWTLLITLAMTLNSCSNEECKNFIELPLPDELVRYVDAWKPGSWWVFHSINGAYDSLYTLGFQEEYEFLSMGDRCNKVRKVGMYISTQTLSESGVIDAGYARFFSPQTIASAAFGDLNVELDASGIVETSRAIPNYGSVQVGVEIYSNALILRGKDPSYSPQEVVWADGIGPIRFIHQGDTFNLQNYHVAQ